MGAYEWLQMKPSLQRQAGVAIAMSQLEQLSHDQLLEQAKKLLSLNAELQSSVEGAIVRICELECRNSLLKFDDRVPQTFSMPGES
jgi:hypothetical protein